MGEEICRIDHGFKMIMIQHVEILCVQTKFMSLTCERCQTLNLLYLTEDILS